MGSSLIVLASTIFSHRNLYDNTKFAVISEDICPILLNSFPKPTMGCMSTFDSAHFKSPKVQKSMDDRYIKRFSWDISEEVLSTYLLFIFPEINRIVMCGRYFVLMQFH
ncbi:hypothetical protein AVEN_43894-1 [Araneus ventricosus]|uniref:Uncharacterized protein n=1 Tax=Araneus ventricosus TaxID=182803 RepID=A0A4Y2JZI6_ARAVE|nr:hypothetical protein AVEN_43894-1 [Araneus ventricosus]